MLKNDAIRLRHMMEAACEARRFASDRNREDLEDDRMLVLSLIKDIEIIGEAARQVSFAARSELPAIPWEDIIGMRHRLVHVYFDINLNILWKTIQNDLPALIAILDPLVSGEDFERQCSDGENIS